MAAPSSGTPQNPYAQVGVSPPNPYAQVANPYAANNVGFGGQQQVANPYASNNANLAAPGSGAVDPFAPRKSGGTGQYHFGSSAKFDDVPPPPPPGQQMGMQQQQQTFSNQQQQSQRQPAKAGSFWD